MGKGYNTLQHLWAIIVREGGNLNIAVKVNYETKDGSICSPYDCTEAVGTLPFQYLGVVFW